MTPCDFYPILPETVTPEHLLTALPPILELAEVTALRVPLTLQKDKPLFSKLVPLLHKHDVAIMLDSADHTSISPDLLKVADGVHSTAVTSLAPLRSQLGDNIQLGCLCHSRDDAMQAGESGADYIAFPPEQTDLIGWWASVMELPTVAESITSPESALQAAKATADFLAIPLRLDGEDTDRLKAILTAVETASETSSAP